LERQINFIWNLVVGTGILQGVIQHRINCLHSIPKLIETTVVCRTTLHSNSNTKEKWLLVTGVFGADILRRKLRGKPIKAVRFVTETVVFFSTEQVEC